MLHEFSRIEQTHVTRPRSRNRTLTFQKPFLDGHLYSLAPSIKLYFSYCDSEEHQGRKDRRHRVYIFRSSSIHLPSVPNEKEEMKRIGGKE